MKAPTRALAVLLILGALGLVFSPLVATLAGTGLRPGQLLPALREATGPLGGSVVTALYSGGVSLLLGLPFALCVEKAGRTWRRIFWAGGLLVLMVPPYLVGESWIVLLGPAGKLSRLIWILFGAGPRSHAAAEAARFTVPGFVFTEPVVGVVMGACLFPIVALAVASAWRRTDRRVFESARLAQGARGVRRIAAQVLAPPALGAALLVFAITLTEFAVPQLLRVRTVAESIYERIQEGEVATAAALGLVLLPLVVAAGALGIWVLTRARLASLAGLEGEVPKFAESRGAPGRVLRAGLVAFAALLPALLLPFISLVWLAVTAASPPASAPGPHQVLQASGFLGSLHGAWELAHDDAVRTVVLAALAATLATILATALARLGARSGCRPLLGALGAGLAVPAPIVGLGLVTLWNRDWSEVIYQSPVIVLLAWFARFLPVAIFLMLGALARVPRELEEAAALAGRKPLQRFLGVVVPGILPGLVASWLATYVLCATEFSATLLVNPPGSPLLAPSIVNLMRRGQDPEIAACQFLLLAVIGLPLLFFALAAIFRARSRNLQRLAA